MSESCPTGQDERYEVCDDEATLLRWRSSSWCNQSHIQSKIPVQLDRDFLYHMGPQK